jgi:YfiH family protein
MNVDVKVLAEAPQVTNGIAVWSYAFRSWHGLFLGRGAPPRGEALPSGLVPPSVASAWLRQEHGSRVLAAHAGDCGAGDALVVRAPGIAAVVATADCVPILAIGRDAVAVHAGWRGIVAGIVPRAIEALDAGEPLAAWIGPAIGPCCYEVGEEVARAVEAACAAPVRAAPSAAGRPRIDLRRAVAAQLVAAGVGTIRLVDHCTRCRPEWLSSHRRDGESAGRNLAVLWRED